jgi:immune inhibitor A
MPRRKKPDSRSPVDPRDLHQRCLVAPSPQLRERLLERLRSFSDSPGITLGGRIVIEPPKRPGFNDGLIIPGSEYPLGTPLSTVRRAAAARRPLRGPVRVIVVLVDFSDAPMTATPDHFRDLFFSTGEIATGSVREYFTEASHGLLTLTGEVVGPYRLPRTLASYTGGKAGTENPEPNARTMARDAAMLANAAVNFAPYDNDRNGFVDAFIVVHAGPGAEETGNQNHIWSHKWVLNGGAYNADGTKIFGYLTIPEDSKIGVCAHELGHLLFGWPDLYDTDGSSEGVGNWCLMGGGSWNGSGDIPSHPSAWCKADQGWVSVVNRTANGIVTVADVKSDHKVYRLWKDGGGGKEYFLLENRQRTLYDRKLPGEGLLVYHVDEAIDGNEDEHHPFIKLLEADGLNHLREGANRGDPGDPYPGASKNVSLTSTSTPHSKSYGDRDACVTITGIGANGKSIRARLGVRCAGRSAPKSSSRRTSRVETSRAGTVRASRKRSARKKSPVRKRAKKSVAARRRARRR